MKYFRPLLFLSLIIYCSVSLSDNLLISTSGTEGATTASRTFTAKESTNTVKIRYKFQTAEVPGGYFGSEFNDTYSIQIKTGDSSKSDSNAMNSLGLGAFNVSGSTAWREAALSVKGGDNVQVKASVSNVSDNLFDSNLLIDLVEEASFEVTSAELFDIDNSTLKYLSSDSHSYFNGNTRIHGKINIQGKEGDGVKDIVFEVIQNGTVAALGILTESVRSQLVKNFDESGKISIDSPKLIFNVNSINNIDTSTNGTVALRVKAISNNGEESVKEVKSVGILSRFTGDKRYSKRDAAEGGDDWAIPSVRDLVLKYPLNTYGDFSNMNGGRFPPHKGHQNGTDVDGWFSGYNSLNAAAANKIIEHLNADGGEKIITVFATYPGKQTGEFYKTIKDVTLADGRKATSVIKYLGGHKTHFHWKMKKSRV